MKEALQILDEALSRLYDARERRSIAQAVLEHVLHVDRTHLLLMRNERLSDDLRQTVACMAGRLASGEPLQYVTGEAWFCGLRLAVGPSVLIPRPETEELVGWALQAYDDRMRRVLDIGTGSGCIAIALAKMRPQWRVEAVDVAESALQVARKNADDHGVSVVFHRADALQMQGVQGEYDLIISNPPYITPSEQRDMHLNVLEHEPHTALFVPEEDPLLYYRHIARYARHALKAAEGSLFFEINRRYGADVVALLEQEGFVQCELRRDLSGNDRMVHAIKP